MSILFFYVMTICLNVNIIAFVFQPEFPGLLFSVLGNGKTWIITILGPFIALIPDLLYSYIKYIYFPNPTEKLMKSLKNEIKAVSPLIV